MPNLTIPLPATTLAESRAALMAFFRQAYLVVGECAQIVCTDGGQELLRPHFARAAAKLMHTSLAIHAALQSETKRFTLRTIVERDGVVVSDRCYVSIGGYPAEDSEILDEPAPPARPETARPETALLDRAGASGRQHVCLMTLARQRSKHP